MKAIAPTPHVPEDPPRDDGDRRTPQDIIEDIAQIRLPSITGVNYAPS